MYIHFINSSEMNIISVIKLIFMENFTGIIYRAYCLSTKKSYIGQTSNPINIRKNQHLSASFNENDKSWHLYFHRAIRKYGIDNFEWTILEKISSDTKENLYECLNVLEIKYIKQYNSYYNGYNLTLGGNTARNSPKKIIIYNENGNIINTYNSAKEVSTLLNKSEAIIRSICRKEQLFLYVNKIRYIIRYADYNLTEQEIKYIQSLNYSKNIIQYDIKGNKLAIYESCKKAAEVLNCKDYNIRACCDRNSKYVNINNNKYIFRYNNDFVSKEDILKLCKDVYKIKAINSKTKKVIGIYNSYMEASKALNISPGSISNCCKGKLKSAGKINGIKIFWEYAT